MKIVSVNENPLQTQTAGAVAEAQDTEFPVKASLATQANVIQFRQQDGALQEGEAAPIQGAVIKVVSAGGGGMNALNLMIEKKLAGVDFIAINTDVQHLYNKSKSKIKLQIGAKITGGLGAGGDPEKGKKAAEEDMEALSNFLKGADMVFITAGMGGGTGTGSAPVIAKAAKDLGALTVAVVTTPFDFEGRYKMKIALDGIEKLRKEVDTLIVIPNQHLFKLVDNNTSWDKAYVKSDEVLCNDVQGIAELITTTGVQNIDFADVKAIMENKGDALMGIGKGSGDKRAMDAVKSAIDNPLLEDTNIEGATGVLINITAPNDIKLVEIQEIVNSIKEKCSPDVNLKYGLHIVPDAEDNSIQITVIATGFSEEGYRTASKAQEKKSKNADVLEYADFINLRDRIKKPDTSLGFLPPKDFQNDLDVPSFLRNQNFFKDDNLVLDKAESM